MFGRVWEGEQVRSGGGGREVVECSRRIENGRSGLWGNLHKGSVKRRHKGAQRGKRSTEGGKRSNNGHEMKKRGRKRALKQIRSTRGSRAQRGKRVCQDSGKGSKK